MKLSLKRSFGLLLLCLFGGVTVVPASISWAQEISVQQKTENARAIQLFEQGVQEFYKGQFREAQISWEEALRLYQQLNDQKGIVNSLNNLGVFYRSLGEHVKAIQYYERSLKITQQIGDQKGAAYSQNILGNIYYFLGEYAKAIQYYERSLEITQRFYDKSSVAKSLNQLGLVYDSLEEFARAIQYYERSLEIMRQIGDQNGVAKSLNQLGLTYFSLGEFSLAIQYYARSLKIVRQIGDQHGVADSLNNLGLVFSALGDYSKAIKYYEESLVITRQIGDQNRNQDLTRELSGAEAPFIFHQMRKVAQQQNATIVEYTLTSSNQLFVWVFSPIGSISYLSIDGSQLHQPLASLEEQTLNWLGNVRGIKDMEQDKTVFDLLEKKYLTATVTPNVSPGQKKNKLTYLRQLYALLIAPIETYLPEDPDERVIFIPHRSLFRVPFPALLGKDSKYLIDKHTILTAPSIQSLLHIQPQLPRNQGPKEALVIGNPTPPSLKFRNLEGAEVEAKSIAKLLNTTAVMRLNRILCKTPLESSKFVL